MIKGINLRKYSLKQEQSLTFSVDFLKEKLLLYKL